MTEPVSDLAAAIFLAVAVMAITEYLLKPLKESPKAADFLVRIGLAYYESNPASERYRGKEPSSSLVEPITIWVTPYITFILGFALSAACGVDFVAKYLPNANPILSLLITAAIVGGGSNTIHRLTQGQQ